MGRPGEGEALNIRPKWDGQSPVGRWGRNAVIHVSGFFSSVVLSSYPSRDAPLRHVPCRVSAFLGGRRALFPCSLILTTTFDAPRFWQRCAVMWESSHSEMSLWRAEGEGLHARSWLWRKEIHVSRIATTDGNYSEFFGLCPARDQWQALGLHNLI